MNTTPFVTDIEHREFWRELCPGMTIEGPAISTSAAMHGTDALFADLKRERFMPQPTISTRVPM